MSDTPDLKQQQVEQILGELHNLRLGFTAIEDRRKSRWQTLVTQWIAAGVGLFIVCSTMLSAFKTGIREMIHLQNEGIMIHLKGMREDITELKKKAVKDAEQDVKIAKLEMQAFRRD